MNGEHQGRVRRPQPAGFSALELLVIIVIICVVAAIGVPTLHARAKTSVLESNLQSLAELVTEKVAEGYSPQYRQSGDGNADRYLSTYLEESLSTAIDGRYVNPTVGKTSGTTIVNTSLPAPGSPETRPAVLITDSADYQYLLFNTLAASEREALAGTLVVAFDQQGASVDVFYVDGKGCRSTSVVNVPMG
jgi:type II secretory pathway pseudopilin PulG